MHLFPGPARPGTELPEGRPDKLMSRVVDGPLELEPLFHGLNTELPPPRGETLSKYALPFSPTPSTAVPRLVVILLQRLPNNAVCTRECFVRYDAKVLL